MSHSSVVVSDTSIISNLIVINQLDLLRKVFDSIIIPTKVHAEILELSKFKIELSEYKNANWISVKAITDFELFNKLSLKVDAGEAEAITLAKEINAQLILIDERDGWKQAQKLGLNTIGLLGVLLQAKKEKHLTEIKPLMILLRDKAEFWISNNLFIQLLEMANEQ